MILYMVAKDKQPCTVVEGQGFKALMSFLAKGFKVPRAQTVSNRLMKKLPSLMAAAKQKIRSAEYVSLTADLWEDCNKQGYLGKLNHDIYVVKRVINFVFITQVSLPTSYIIGRQKLCFWS